MYKAYAGKDGTVLYVTKAKDNRNQNFKRSQGTILRGYNAKATVQIGRKFSGVAKGWHSVAQGGAFVTPWLRACHKPNNAYNTAANSSQ